MTFDVPRNRGRNARDGDDLWIGLMRACDTARKDFLTAKRFAESIATGKLSMEQSVAIVERLMERDTVRVRGRARMNVEEALAGLQRELDSFDEGDAELDQQIRELQQRKRERLAERRKLERAVKSLGGVVPVKERRQMNGRGGGWEKEPCPWPGCSDEICKGGITRLNHLGKHERITGMKLDDALVLEETA